MQAQILSEYGEDALELVGFIHGCFAYRSMERDEDGMAGATIKSMAKKLVEKDLWVERVDGIDLSKKELPWFFDRSDSSYYFWNEHFGVYQPLGERTKLFGLMMGMAKVIHQEMARGMSEGRKEKAERMMNAGQEDEVLVQVFRRVCTHVRLLVLHQDQLDWD